MTHLDYLRAAPAAVSLMSAALATPALASDVPSVVPEVRIAVRGAIRPRCSLTPSAGPATFQRPQSETNTVRAETVSLGFAVECNTGFAVRMASTNGGLSLGQDAAVSGFADTMAYEASISLPGLPAVLECRSLAMTGQGADCVETMEEARLSDGVLSGNGRIDLRLIPDDRPLLAGRYEDFLVVTLSPLVGGSGGAL